MNGGGLIAIIIAWVFVSFFIKAAKQFTVSPPSNQGKVQQRPNARIDVQAAEKRPSEFAEPMRPFSADSDAYARFAGYGGEQNISVDPLETQAKPSASGPLPGLRLSFQANEAVQGIIYAEILARKNPLPRNQR